MGLCQQVPYSTLSKKVEDGIEGSLTYCDLPSKHWTCIRTNSAIERLNQKIRRHTRVMGSFSDGNPTLMLVCAWLRYVGQQEEHLEAALECWLTSFM